MSKWKSAPAIVILALTGCGSGNDFEISTKVDRQRLMSVFSGINQGSNELTQLMPIQRAIMSQPEANVLLFTIPSSESKAGSTFRFAFVDAEVAGLTKVQVRIDVPTIRMSADTELSERKVEDSFEKSTRELLEALSQNQSTERAIASFTQNFMALAVVTNPADMKKMKKMASNAESDWEPASAPIKGSWGPDPSDSEGESGWQPESDSSTTSKAGWGKADWSR